MDACPDRVDRCDEGLIFFVWGSVWQRATVCTCLTCENYVLVNKQEITLNLLVEGVWQLHTARVARPWLGPFSADATSLHYLWN